MNAIFTVITIASTVLILICAPEAFLPAVLDGSSQALKCALTLFAVYAFWMGLSAVAEDAKITNGTAKLLAPVCKKLFKTDNDEAIKNIAMNASCNLLGIGGAATPFAVKAVDALEKDKNEFAQNLLFIINATSIQLIPTTVISLRAAAGSAAAHDIALPSLIATVFSTGVAVGAYILYGIIKRKKGALRRKKCST